MITINYFILNFNIILIAKLKHMIIVLIIILYVIFITHNHIKLNIIVVDEDVD
jgi:hypothetical protein